MQEVDAMVALLSKRGKGCSHMATSLTDQLQKKMDSASLSTNEVLQLSDHLVAAGLPEACKDELLASCDKLAMKESHPSSAVKLQLQQPELPILGQLPDCCRLAKFAKGTFVAQCECAGEATQAHWSEECQGRSEETLFGHPGFDASPAKFRDDA